jgi:uracil-DNA glycosylase
VEPRGNSKAPIFLLGDFPTLSSPYGGEPFQDRPGIVINTALRRLKAMYMKADNGVERWGKLDVFKSYAVQCATDDKPLKDTSVKCRHFLNQNLQRIQPKLVMAFGADAMVFFSLKAVKSTRSSLKTNYVRRIASRALSKLSGSSARKSSTTPTLVNRLTVT